MAVSGFHLANPVGPHALDLLLLKLDLLALHLGNHFLVARFFGLAFVPLLESDLGNDAVILFFLLRLVVDHALLMPLNLLLDHVLAQLDEADLKPLLENLVALLFLDLLGEPFLLFNS